MRKQNYPTNESMGSFEAPHFFWRYRANVFLGAIAPAKTF